MKIKIPVLALGLLASQGGFAKTTLTCTDGVYGGKNGSVFSVTVTQDRKGIIVASVDESWADGEELDSANVPVAAKTAKGVLVFSQDGESKPIAPAIAITGFRLAVKGKKSHLHMKDTPQGAYSDINVTLDCQ